MNNKQKEAIILLLDAKDSLKHLYESLSWSDSEYGCAAVIESLLNFIDVFNDNLEARNALNLMNETLNDAICTRKTKQKLYEGLTLKEIYDKALEERNDEITILNGEEMIWM